MEIHLIIKTQNNMLSELNKLFKLIWQKKNIYDNKSWKYFYSVFCTDNAQIIFFEFNSQVHNCPHMSTNTLWTTEFIDTQKNRSAKI